MATDHLRKSRSNWLNVPLLERDAGVRLNREKIAQIACDPASRFVPLCGGQNLVKELSGQWSAVHLGPAELQALPIEDPGFIYLGHSDGRQFLTLDLPDTPRLKTAISAFGRLVDLRRFAALLGDPEATLLGYAKAMNNWHQNHRFCGRCGAPNASRDGGHVLVCRNNECGRNHYPRTDPAVIVLVEHEGRALLGRKPEWPDNRYSTIAGFVEPGESAEQAVVREVGEETGVTVARVTYHSSQPWPFPGALMLGYVGEASSTSIHLGDDELADARWLGRDELANHLVAGDLLLPTPISISYRLIEDWFDRGYPEKLSGIVSAST